MVGTASIIVSSLSDESLAIESKALETLACGLLHISKRRGLSFDFSLFDLGNDLLRCGRSVSLNVFSNDFQGLDLFIVFSSITHKLFITTMFSYF